MKSCTFSSTAAAAAAAAAVAFTCLSSPAAAAEPKTVALSFARSTDTSSLVKRQLNRRASLNMPIAANQGVYSLNISVGTPPQSLGVVLDTGSSDLWLPSSSPDNDLCDLSEADCGGLGGFDYSDSSSFDVQDSMGPFQARYGDGTQVVGSYFTDNVQIGNARLTNVTMAIALQGQSPNAIRGIMGIGYISGESPTQPERQSQRLTPYPNIISVLQSEGVINTLAYSLYLNDLQADQGTILFGGVDRAKYSGNLGVVPIQPNPAISNLTRTSGGSSDEPLAAPSSTAAPSRVYDALWVSLTGVAFSNSSGMSEFDLGSPKVSVLLDSGTSLIYLPDAATAAIYDQFGVIFDEQQGVPLISCNAPADGSLNFTFGSGGPAISVPLSQLIISAGSSSSDDDDSVPRLPDGSPACLFGITGAGDSSSDDPSDAAMILGDTFLSSAYVVYDLTNNQIGLAQGRFNVTSSSIVEISSTIPGDSTVTGQPYSLAGTLTSEVMQTTGRSPRVTSISSARATFQVTNSAAGTRGASATNAGQGGSGAANTGAATPSSAAMMLAPPRLSGAFAAVVAVTVGLLTGGFLTVAAL